MKQGTQLRLRRRAYLAAVAALTEIEVSTDDLSDDDDREIERIIRKDIALVLTRAWQSEAALAQRTRSRK